MGGVGVCAVYVEVERVCDGVNRAVGWVISVCRKLWIPWHRNCRAPPPNLLLNPDILDILKPSTLYWKINRKIKPINLKLFNPFTVLTSF